MCHERKKKPFNKFRQLHATTKNNVSVMYHFDDHFRKEQKMCKTG